MSELLGLLFFVVVIAGFYFGLRAIAKARPKSEQEFEKSVAESTSMLGASMNALQELLNPEAAKSKEVQMQLKEGRYSKKRREGKSGGPADIETEIEKGEE